MIAKDYVDRHNIDHLHEESSIDLSVHLAAANWFQNLGLGKRDTIKYFKVRKN